ncbi:MAG: bacteriohemerythrin [Deferribacteraceae bacterium]|jgi:hemerythrin-like metal-binding protein|nr:bacteriohemerythrin [Deferribacteraceae bacterium]
MEFTPAMSVKILKIDTEHKKLISLTDTLDKAMKEGKGKDVITKVLDELLTYTKTHFKGEEEMMAKYSYPGIDEQKQQHTTFVNKIAELQTKYKAGNTMISVDAIGFLNKWIVNHIQKIDMKYSTFFNEKGVR